MPPAQKGGQGGDIGSQYRTGIYWHDEEQRQVRPWLLLPPSVPACSCACPLRLPPPPLRPGLTALRGHPTATLT